jgi:hypothetical protein
MRDEHGKVRVWSQQVYAQQVIGKSYSAERLDGPVLTLIRSLASQILPSRAFAGTVLGGRLSWNGHDTRLGAHDIVQKVSVWRKFSKL